MLKGQPLQGRAHYLRWDPQLDHWVHQRCLAALA